MKKRSKSIISLALAGMLALGLTACGDGAQGTSGGSKTDSAEAKKYVYRMTELSSDLFDSNSSITYSTYMNDRIYFLKNESFYDKQTGMTLDLVSMKEDGSDVQTVNLINTVKDNPYYTEEPDGAIPYEETNGTSSAKEAQINNAVDDLADPVDDVEPTDDTENTAEPVDTNPAAGEEMSDLWVNFAQIDETGVCLVVESSKYSYDANGEYIDGGASLNLYQYNLDGSEKGKIEISDNQNENYVYVNTMATDDQGNTIVMTGDKVLVFDKDGNKTSEIATDSTNMNVQLSFMGKDGKLKMVTYNEDWTKMTLKSYNIQTNAYEADVELPGILTNYGLNPGKTYDLILTSSIGVYGYNIGDTDVTQILSYINSDINSNDVNSVVEAGEKKLLCVYTDSDSDKGNYEPKLAILNYVDPSEIPDEEILTIACNYLDYNMRKRIVEYNKSSESYRITVKDYSQYNTADDYNAGTTQLNNDILSGQVPDILVVDSYNMPISSYIAKGVLADIGKLIDEDESINKDDYFTNVFDAYSVNGKLYSVIPSFYVQTVIGKTSDVGDRTSWTMDDLKELMAKYPDKSVFGNSTTRDTILWQIMMYNGADFIDATSGKCNFDTKEFADLLTFVKQFPAEYDWENEEDDYWQNYQSQYRDGRTLLMTTSISEISEYLYCVYGYFGEPTSLIGYPSKEGMGAVVQANNQYAISAKSKNIQGAWDFVKYYLTPEYQNGEDMSYCIPILKDAFMKKIDAAKERPFWTNEDGTKEYYDNTFYLGDQEIIIPTLTDEEGQMLLNYISSVSKAYNYDENIDNIIKEEAAAFFENQKSAEDVTKIIQSRAQVYINESR